MRLFTEREIKIFAFGTAAALLIAVAIAMSVSISRNQARATYSVLPDRSEFELEVTDLAVPDEYREISLSESYVFRPRLERWNVEQIERYWVDPRILQLEELEAETDALIRDFFEKVQ